MVPNVMTATTTIAVITTIIVKSAKTVVKNYNYHKCHNGHTSTKVTITTSLMRVTKATII